MMYGCEKCNKIGGWTLLVLGVLLLLVDVGVWSFWGLQWWTLAFLYLGLVGLVHGSCKDCAACYGMPSGKKKK